MGEIQNKQQYRNALNKFSTLKKKLPSKILEQITFNTKSRHKERILIVMDKSTHGEHLPQPLQRNNKQFKVTVTFPTAYISIFNVTNKNNNFYFTKPISDKNGFIQITTPPCAYEMESLNKEIERIIIDEEHHTESIYPYAIKPNFSSLGSIMEISTQGPIFTFVPDDSIRDLLGFNKTTICEEYNISPHPVDNLSFDNIFLERNIAQGLIFRRRRSGIIHNFTMDFEPGYRYLEKFRGRVNWYMMESKDNISLTSFTLINENNQLISFNGQRITFRLSTKEI